MFYIMFSAMSRRATSWSSLFWLALALLSVGALEIFTPSDDFEQYAHGVFPMKLDSTDLTCEDVNYEFSGGRRELGTNLRGQRNADGYGGCPYSNHACAQVRIAVDDALVYDLYP
jgi:hypothetical protein